MTNSEAFAALFEGKKIRQQRWEKENYLEYRLDCGIYNNSGDRVMDMARCDLDDPESEWEIFGDMSDYEKMFEYYKFARAFAVNKYGTWLAFSSEPTSDRWYSEDHSSYDGVVLPKYAPKNYTGDWMDSLIMNPYHERDN